MGGFIPHGWISLLLSAHTRGVFRTHGGGASFSELFLKRHNPLLVKKEYAS